MDDVLCEGFEVLKQKISSAVQQGGPKFSFRVGVELIKDAEMCCRIKRRSLISA